MTAATITALIGATAALLTAITALLNSIRGTQQIKSHLAAHTGTATASTGPTGGTAPNG